MVHVLGKSPTPRQHMAFWTVPPDWMQLVVSAGVGAGAVGVGTVGALGTLADICKMRSQYCSSSSLRASLRKAASFAASCSRSSFFRVKRFRTRVFFASEICVVPMATRPTSTTADRDICMLYSSHFLRFDFTLHETGYQSVLDVGGTSCLSSTCFFLFCSIFKRILCRFFAKRYFVNIQEYQGNDHSDLQQTSSTNNSLSSLLAGPLPCCLSISRFSW